MAGSYQKALDPLEEMEREDENLYPLELDRDDEVIKEQHRLDLDGDYAVTKKDILRRLALA